jgi:hypothetical protein
MNEFGGKENRRRERPLPMRAARSLAAILLTASVLTAASVVTITVATASPASACTVLPSGTYLGTWQGAGIFGADEFSGTFSGTTFSGTVTFVTNQTALFAGDTFSLNVDCTGNVTGTITLPFPDPPADVSATVQPDGTLSGIWSVGTLSGTWATGPVYAQASNPSTSSLSTGSSTSPSAPIQASVTSPTVGSISIGNALTSNSPAPTGYTLLDTFVDISAPTGSPSAPLQLSFLLDPSVLAANGVTASTNLLGITVFRNGAGVPQCLTTSPISPDPCEESATWTGTPGTSDVQITVLTSQASIWGFGVRPGLIIVTSSLPNYRPGLSYGPVTLQTSGEGTSTAPYATTLKWKKVSLLKGLKISAAGVLSGTAGRFVTAGPSSVTVQVTESVITLNGTKKVKTKTTAKATIPITIT